MNAELSTDLRREVADLRAEVAALRALTAPRRSPRGWGRRLLPLALVALILASMPLSLWAASFADLNPGSAHNSNINAIADAGITKGCFDAQHYCPNDFVTREQMASFLARTAGLGGNPPVANAAQLGGVPASGYLRPVGDLVYQVSPLGLVAAKGVVVPAIGFTTNGSVEVTRPVIGSSVMLLPLSAPASLFGTTFGVASVTVCYAADAGAKIDITGVFETLGNGTYAYDVSEDTDRTSATHTCYTLTDPTPSAITGAPFLEFTLGFTNTFAKVTIDRVSVVLKPIP